MTPSVLQQKCQLRTCMNISSWQQAWRLHQAPNHGDMLHNGALFFVVQQTSHHSVLNGCVSVLIEGEYESVKTSIHVAGSKSFQYELMSYVQEGDATASEDDREPIDRLEIFEVSHVVLHLPPAQMIATLRHSCQQ